MTTAEHPLARGSSPTLRLARVAGGVAAAVGLGALIGWWLAVPLLRSGLSGGVAMNPLVAMVFALGGLSVMIEGEHEAGPALLRTGRVLAWGVVAIAGLKLLTQVVGGPYPFEQVLFRPQAARLGTDGPRPFSAGTALLFSLLGLGLLLLRARREAWRLVAGSIGLLLAFPGALALLVYAYRRLAGTTSAGLNGFGIIVGLIALSAGLTAAASRRDRLRQGDHERHALRRRVNLAFVVAVAILILTGGVSIWSTVRSRRADTMREASTTRRAELRSVLLSMQDAETGQRGFVLTGNPVFLSPYRNGVDSLPAQVRRASELFAGDTRQSARFLALQPLLTGKLETLAKAVALEDSGRHAAAVDLVRSGVGERAMGRVRAQSALMVAYEDSLIRTWTARARRDTGIALSTTVIAALLAVFFLVLAGIAINRDFRRREQAEAALGDSERRLSQIVELLPTMVFLKEPKELRFVRFNQAAEELLGFPRDALLGKNDFDFFPEAEARQFVAKDREVLASDGVIDIPEETIHTKASGVRILHTKKVAVRDEQGRPLFLLGVSQDITEQKQLEAERDRFFTLSLDMLCIAKSDGYFKRLNPAFTQTLGWSVEELLARPFLDFVHPDDRAATLREVERQTVAGEEVLHFENRYQHEDGSWRILSWKSVPYPGGLMYATARDVTELREAEAALRQSTEAAEAANRAKSDFLAKMSHELRTPLNSIIGFSEILEDEGVGPLTDKQRRYVGNVLASGRNLLQLINDILDLSKVEAGRMELSLSEFDVRTALDQVRSIVDALAEKKRLAVSVTVEESLPLLTADQAKFKQVMFNLLGNAIKFTPEGGRVDVSARLMPARSSANGGRREPDWIEVSVADNGIGISAEHQERVFGEFEQVGSGPSASQEGTGLGLALTRKLLELHGGRIWVESTLGLGSTFRFLLPRGRPSEEAPSAGAPGSAEGFESAGPLVLVIDDEAQARDLICYYLTTGGYRVATAATGSEAVEMARELRPDAITLDILLPDKDGLQILAQLKSVEEIRSVPVVVVSITDQKDLGFSLGAADWLVKPIRRNDLLAALDRTIGIPAGGPPKTVLIVDDEPGTIEYLTELLGQRGFRVLAASGGQSGIDLALDQQPDLIILDLMMPEVNGFDVVRVLRKHPEARSIPILILTAMELTSADMERLRNSVRAVVAKGERNDLLSELERICPIHPPESGGGVPVEAGR